MSNKNDLSFGARLWLFIIIVCLLVLGVHFIRFIYFINSFERCIIVAVSIFTAGIVISTGIMSRTLLKVFDKSKDNDETK